MLLFTLYWIQFQTSILENVWMKTFKTVIILLRGKMSRKNMWSDRLRRSHKQPLRWIPAWMFSACLKEDETCFPACLWHRMCSGKSLLKSYIIRFNSKNLQVCAASGGTRSHEFPELGVRTVHGSLQPLWPPRHCLFCSAERTCFHCGSWARKNALIRGHPSAECSYQSVILCLWPFFFFLFAIKLFCWSGV